MIVRPILTSATSLVLGLYGCQELFEKDASQITAETETVVEQLSKAYENYPKTLDRTSILKHYAADYSGVKDGELETVKDLENMFDELAERIKLGGSHRNYLQYYRPED